MKKLIRVRAVEDAVVFVVDPATGVSAKPLRSVGRDGPSASAERTRPFEDVPDLPIYRRAIATKDLELVADPAPEPEPEAPAALPPAPAALAAEPELAPSSTQPAPKPAPEPVADTEVEKESA